MNKISKWRPTLRFTLSTFLFMIFMITGGVVVSLGYYTSRDALVTFSERLMKRVADGTQNQLDSFLAPTEQSVLLARSMFQSGAVDVENIEQLEAFFFHTLETNSSLALLNYGDQKGNYLMVKRNADGSLATKLIQRGIDEETGREELKVTWRLREPGDPISKYRIHVDEDDRFDPRLRPWYKCWSKGEFGRGGHVRDDGRQKSDPRSQREETQRTGAKSDGGGEKSLQWTDVYVFHTDKVPGITASAPLLDSNGELRGVISADVGLMDLSRFLSRLNISPNGKAFIVDGRNRLVAVPNPDNLLDVEKKAGDEDVLRLRRLKNSPYGEFATLAGGATFRKAFQDRADYRPQVFSFSHNDEDYFARLMPVEHQAGRGWIIGVVIPESDVLGKVKDAMTITLLIIVGVMVAGIVLVLGVSRFVSGAMSKLVRETERVRNLDLAPSGEAISRFREVHEVLTAFERMKTGLRSFQKYVPLQLVRMLLRRQIEPKLGGKERDLTILFSDIRNFTTIGEELGPQKLAEKLAVYLTAMTRSIQAPESQGTVDKYIGDAVVAFWNAPEDVSDHPGKACSAALDGLRKIKEISEKDEEFPDFFTRIAIHTGRAIVGHFGSEEHVAYTCIGDDVNLAARLEGLNKIYGTKILVTQAVLDKIEDRFLVRKLDEVVVKGKSRAVTVYELIGNKGDVASNLIRSVELYEEGLELYRQRRWGEAIEIFMKSKELRSDDLAASVMIQRCQGFEESPPDSNWDGVHIYETK